MKTRADRKTVDLSGYPALVGLPPIGFQNFAPNVTARGPMFSARARAHVAGDGPPQPEGMRESDLY